jgi:GTP:adenosylcobinamide-phosphate guanylyltransferase
MRVPERVIILAGRRGGRDAMAENAGVSHKALIPLDGISMLERVAATVRSTLPDAALVLVIDDIPELGELRRKLSAGGPVVVAAPGISPCASVGAVLADPAMTLPMLVVTADHPLLTPEMIRHFLAHLPPDVSAAGAVARREGVTARYTTRRTFWRFRGSAVSGCNLFYLGGDKAPDVVRFWRTVENDRKKPWRIARRIGLGTLMAFAFGRLSLEDAVQRLGNRIGGARIRAVDMPFAEAAIDVDRPDDLLLAGRILRDRGQ